MVPSTSAVVDGARPVTEGVRRVLCSDGPQLRGPRVEDALAGRVRPDLVGLDDVQRPPPGSLPKAAA
jgi:hypothetical protein